jgi:hypothetical protein
MAEKEPEDIVGRLEALRKRAPEEKPPPEEPSPEDERRRRLARGVGILVIVIIIGVVFLAGYTFLYKPMQEGKEAELAAKKAAEQAFLQAKSEKLKEINNAFLGLPSVYITAKASLLDELNKAKTTAQISAIDVATPATEAWRSYLKDKVEELMPAENIKIEVEGQIYRGYTTVLETIDRLSYIQLKDASVGKFYREYFPIRLTREQAGGWAEPGNIVNIWLKEDENVTLLAKDAVVTAIMRGKESGVISLTERESKAEAGGGAEGKGTMSTFPLPPLSSGGWGTLPGSFAGSAGGRSMQTETIFSVDVSEIQKVIAAGKVSEEDLDESLRNFGYELNRIESEMGIGDLEAEYLILFEVSEDEVPDLVLKASPTSPERENIFVTISKK